MLGRLGRTLAAMRGALLSTTSGPSRGTATPVLSSLSALPLVVNPRHPPIWVGRQRPRSETRLPQAYVGKTLRGLEWAITYARLPLTVFNPSDPQPRKRKLRAVWRSIRRDLPRMSGRQWRKMRQQMFLRAKAA